MLERVTLLLTLAAAIVVATLSLGWAFLRQQDLMDERQRRDDVATEIQRLRSELQEANARNLELAERSTQLAKDIAEKRLALRDAAGSYSELESRLADLDRRVATGQTDGFATKALGRKVASLEEALEDLRDDWQRNAERTQERVGELTETRSQLAERLKSIESKNSEIHKGQAELGRLVRKSGAANRSHDEKITSLMALVEKYDERFAGLEKGIQEFHERFRDIAAVKTEAQAPKAPVAEASRILPRVEAQIVAVDGKNIAITSDDVDKLQVGQLLYLLRGERSIGVARIFKTDVESRFAAATVESIVEGEAVRNGDRASTHRIDATSRVDVKSETNKESNASPSLRPRPPPPPPRPSSP